MEFPAVTRGSTRTRAELRIGTPDSADTEGSRPEPSPPDSVGEGEASMRELLGQNRQLLAIVNSLPGTAFRYVRRADGPHVLGFISDRAFSIFAISAPELRQDPELLFA